MRPLFLTTPIYYVNAKPHLGHYATTMLADVLKKRAQQQGRPVVMLTGTDEHGEKIQQMALSQNMTEKDFTDKMSAQFQDTWKAMHLDYDIFYRTTTKKHADAVQHALSALHTKGDIVFREYEGLYCVGCERFIPESELDHGLCKDHRRAPEKRSESNYFFMMHRYQDALLNHIKEHPDWIRPAHFRDEMLSFLSQPLLDLCISRPKERLSWGIEIPFDTRFVTYVWFDALLNYLAATGWPEPNWDAALWAGSRHLIAKDIVKAHAIYWGTMLLALEIPLPEHIDVSGYWLVEGMKMSKSLGNVVEPMELETHYGPETLRFYLLKEMSYGLDATMTHEGLKNCVNAYLANGIGNLASRVMTLAQRLNSPLEAQTDETLFMHAAQTQILWDESFDELKYNRAIKAWCDLVTKCDLYVNEHKPWALVQTDEQKLRHVLGVCLVMLEKLAGMIMPVLPRASATLLYSLGRKENAFHIQMVPKLFMRCE